MCKYCDKYDNPIKVYSDDEGVNVEIQFSQFEGEKDTHLYVTLNEGTDFISDCYFKVKYCPFCGKKLETNKSINYTY